MASPIHQPLRRERPREFLPLAAGSLDKDVWSSMGRDERAAWMRKRQELKRLLKGSRTKGR